MSDSELNDCVSERTTKLNRVCMLQMSDHLPQVLDVYMYTYVYFSGLVACGLNACGQVACGLVAYGLVACYICM